MIRARRAFLYMQGYDMKKLLKAKSLNVDTVCLDMEDGVAYNKKIEARTTIASALSSVDFGNSEVAVRINAIGTDLFQDDLAAVLKAKRLPNAIVVPKVASAHDIQFIGEQIENI